MSQLRQVLQRYQAAYLGKKKTAEPPPPIDRDALRKDLQGVIQRSDRILWVALGAMLVLFMGALLTVIVFINNPAQIKTIFGVTGVSFGFLLSQIIGLWRQKFKTETILAIVPVLSEENLREVINKLLATLR